MGVAAVAVGVPPGAVMVVPQHQQHQHIDPHAHQSNDKHDCRQGAGVRAGAKGAGGQG